MYWRVKTSQGGETSYETAYLSPLEVECLGAGVGLEQRDTQRLDTLPQPRQGRLEQGIQRLSQHRRTQR